MHDTKPYTRDTLQKIIAYGKENGYTFDCHYFRYRYGSAEGK